MTVDAQLESSHVPVLYLVELAFSTGTARLTNWGHALTWAGFTWSGMNCLSSVSPIKASDRPEYPALDLGLYPTNSAILATALGPVATYMGKPVTVYQGVLDDQLRPLGDPELAWAGLMSQVRVNTGDGEANKGAIILRCEQPGRDSRGPRNLRLNNAQHQQRWPGDTFLSRVEALSGKPQPWLSVRFQRM